MKSRDIFIIWGCACFLTLLTSCSPVLSSANFWSGAERENKWVKDHFSATVSSGMEEKDGGFENPIPAFKKRNGQKFKIGIVISGEYWEFFENFKGLVQGFSSIGWAKNIVVPENLSQSDELIKWLNITKYSDYIEFSPEYFINLQWGDNLAELNQKYFENTPDVDAVIAYGGMAAKYFYDQETYPVPVLADAITDFFGAGVTKTVDDSGKSFFSGKIDPDLFKRQIRLFHSVTGFKSLGIVYGDDEYGRIYGAVRDIEEVSAELGFEIIRNTNVKEEVADDTVDLYLAALKDVASKADAVYIGASTAVTEYDITKDIVNILLEEKKPSFALEGAIRVKEGILYSFSASGFTSAGIWVATKLTHIFNGVMPSELSQRFESNSSMTVNVATAEQIGYPIPIEILANSDQIFIDWEGNSIANADLTVTDEATEDEYKPIQKEGNEKFKVAVVLSGEYWEFQEHLKGIITGLKTVEWVKEAIYMPEERGAGIDEIFAVLGDNYSDFVEFPEELRINMDWNPNYLSENDLYPLLESADVIIGLGGIAGKALVGNRNITKPILLDAITDPVGSGIVYSVSDSGHNNVTCRIDQTQYQRQVSLFHEFTGFEKLGIIYGDDDLGRLYSAVNDVELVALRENFEIVRNTNVREYMSPETPELYLTALRDICTKVDAVYIGASTAVTEYDIIDDIVQILIETGTPSFALEGEIRVEEGILMGVSSLETEKIGLYNAKKMISILKGSSPRLLDQSFMGVPSIVMNLSTAKSLGLDYPLNTLAVIDKFY